MRNWIRFFGFCGRHSLLINRKGRKRKSRTCVSKHESIKNINKLSKVRQGIVGLIDGVW
jgi:hypothetical protein